MGRKIVITGGVKSGKSACAIEIALGQTEFPDRIFIATATPFDDEMREKIKKHRKERGQSFVTVEEPVRLADAVASANGNTRRCAVVDCLTVWLCNLSLEMDERSAEEQVEKFAEQFEKFTGLLITVTNETGMGVIPPEKQSRAYTAALAALNRRLVSLCDEAHFLVAGAPIRLK